MTLNQTTPNIELEYHTSTKRWRLWIWNHYGDLVLSTIIDRKEVKDSLLFNYWKRKENSFYLQSKSKNKYHEQS